MLESDDLSVASLLKLVYKKGLDASQWREIGTLLKLKPGTLNEIQWAHPHSPKDCLLGVLNAWLMFDKTATLEKYESALNSVQATSFRRCTVAASVIFLLFGIACYHYLMAPVESQPQPLLRYKENIRSLYKNLPEVPGIEMVGFDKTLKFISPVFYELDSQTFHVDKSNELRFDNFFRFTGLGQRILIQGRPGSGKSTLVNRLTKEWYNQTEDSTIAECPLLLRIKLRELRMEQPSGHELSLSDILRYSMGNDIKHIDEELEQYLFEPKNAERVCIILDGLDEYPPAYSDPSNYIYKIIAWQRLKSATVIVLSRPEAYEKLFETSGASGFQAYELIGFNHNGIEEYVSRNIKNAKQFLYHLQKYYKRLYKLCASPLHLAMVVKSYKYRNEFPSSLTEAYTRSLSKSFKPEIGRKRSWGCFNVRLDDFSSLRKCDRDLADTIANVSRLAFRSLVAYDNPYNFTLNGKIMKSIQTKFSISEIHTYLPSGDNYGLLSPHYHKDDYETLISSYSFPHLVIQQFWAAFHVTLVRVNTSHLQEYFVHANFLYFVCGMYSSSTTATDGVFALLLQLDELPRLLDLYTMCGLETRHSSQSLVDTYLKLNGAVLNLDNLVPFSSHQVEVQFFLGFVHLNITRIIFSQDSPSLRLYMDNINDIFPNLATVKIILRWAETNVYSSDFNDNMRLIFSSQRWLAKLEWTLPLNMLVDQEFFNCLDENFDGEIHVVEMGIGTAGSVVEVPEDLSIHENCPFYLWGHYSAVELTPEMFIAALEKFINYFQPAGISLIFNTPVWYLECQYLHALFEALYKSSFYSRVRTFILIDTCSGLFAENLPLLHDKTRGVVAIRLKVSETAVTTTHSGNSGSPYVTLGVLPEHGCTNKRLYLYFNAQKQVDSL